VTIFLLSAFLARLPIGGPIRPQSDARIVQDYRLAA
jgi:hypothetical protein